MAGSDTPRQVQGRTRCRTFRDWHLLDNAVAALVLAALVAAGTNALSASTAHASDFDFEWIGKIELDAAGLTSSDKKARRVAVAALGSYDINITKPYLLKALYDPDQRVRYEAGRILGRHRVAEAAPIVIGWLNEPDSSIKQDAAEILGYLATDAAVKALIRSLGDPDFRVRQRTVVALGTIGTPAVVVPIIGRLDDDKFEVRKAAIEQLERIGDRRAVIPLVSAFNDASMDVRKAAVRAVGRMGERAAVPALLRLLTDPAEEIKSAAVVALGNLRAVDTTDALIEQLDTGASDSYLGEVAYALGQVARGAAGKAGSGEERSPAQRAAQRAVRALVQALAQRSLRAAAREALRNAGAVAVPALVAHLHGTLEGDLSTAVELLRDIGDHRATAALVAELDRGRISRALVLAALQRIGDRRALVPILSLLQTRDAALRLRAMEALRPIIDDLRAADVLVSLLDDPDVEIQVLAVEYLGLMHSRRAVPKLIELVAAASEPRLRLAAVDALGEIADPRAAEPLIKVLQGNASALHVAAANALIYIGDREQVPRLLRMARDPQARARAAAVRSLGGILRGRPEAEVRKLCESLAQRGPLALSLAAIDALGAMGATDSASLLVSLTKTDVHRRRAAAAALGNIRVRSAVPALIAILNTGDDRASGDAAWALSKLADARALDALARATRGRGWATIINATAALATYAPAAYADRLVTLLHHRNRLVRVNAAMGLGRMQVASARDTLIARLGDDPSPLVRVAAVRALSRIGGARAVLQETGNSARDKSVREAAVAALQGPFQAPERSDWRNFHVVDPDRGKAPISQAAYFLAAADGLVTAYYTDARGQVVEEQFPPTAYLLQPRSKASRY